MLSSRIYQQYADFARSYQFQPHHKVHTPFSPKLYSFFLFHIIFAHLLSLAPSAAPEMFAADPGERQVVFSWSPPPTAHRNGVITSYTLSCSPSPSSPPQSPSLSGSLTVTGFSPDTAYSCSVVATNSKGSGPPVNITFTTQQDCESVWF